MAGTSMCGWSAGWLAQILVMVWTAGRFWTRPLRRGVKVCKKLFSFILRKKKIFYPPRALQTLYNSLALPLLSKVCSAVDQLRSKRSGNGVST